MAVDVLIVEDHELLAETLAMALDPDDFRTHVVVPHTGNEVLETARSVQPSIALLDVHLGFKLGNGLGLIGPLVNEGITVVVLTGDTDPVHTATAVKSGAAGVIHKSRPFDDVIAAVQDAAAGRPLLSHWEREQLLTRLNGHPEGPVVDPFSTLTPREEDILAHLAEGRSAQQIAGEEVVSVATVRAQIASVRAKLGVPSQLAAASLALRSGWTPTTDDAVR